MQAGKHTTCLLEIAFVGHFDILQQPRNFSFPLVFQTATIYTFRSFPNLGDLIFTPIRITCLK